MSSTEPRDALPAAEIPQRKPSAAGLGRAGLGEMTNAPPVGIATIVMKRTVQAPKPKSIAVHPIIRVPAPADPLPEVSEDSAASSASSSAASSASSASASAASSAASASASASEPCPAFSQPLLGVQDEDLPLLGSQYAEDLYNYLHVLEEEQAVKADYLRGYEITHRMRGVLIDWLVQVHDRFKLLLETLYRTVAILDRFLQVQPVSYRKLQLVGVTAMLVACKYEETFIPDVKDFAYITDNAFTKSQILEMEQVVLSTLNFKLGRPLPLHFVRRAVKVAKSTQQQYTLAKYLIELVLVDYDMVHYRPSEIAAASLCLSQLVLGRVPWSPTQQQHTTYDEAHLMPIMQHISKNVVLVNTGKIMFQAVRNKYSSGKLMKISTIPQLTSSIVRNMAAAASS